MTNIRAQHIAAVLLVALLITLFQAVPADAHSTKGRIKIPLAKDALTVDDVAYFMESYVHHQLYRERSGDKGQRFYVREFKQVDQKGNRADIHFIALDVKDNTTFPDKMRINRNHEGIWFYQPENKQEPVEVYTYVPKWNYYYRKYVIPVGIAGIAIAAALLIGIRIKKRKK